MPPLVRWNQRQIRVFERYRRRFGTSLTPDVVLLLAHRYAAKHGGTRMRITA